MSNLVRPQIRKIREADVDGVVEAAGGARAHPDQVAEGERNADYLIGDTLIELKLLDEEGMLKPERRTKLAALFRPAFPYQPVVVLDPDVLSLDGRRQYLKILETPVKSAVSKARRQLKQSRSSISNARTNVLMVVNNAYSALDNNALLEIVERRVRNDTTEIDAIIVAGCYFYSDGVDSWVIWPFELHPIRPEADFSKFDDLKAAWDDMAQAITTELMLGFPSQADVKEAVDDCCFDIDGITYVKPGPPVGAPSAIYGSRRPRLNTKGYDDLQHIGLTVPSISRADFHRFQQALAGEPALETWDAWIAYLEGSKSDGRLLQPTVPVRVESHRWLGWRRKHRQPATLETLGLFANERFADEVISRIRKARKVSGELPTPGRFVVSITEVIGRDEQNDMSSIAIATCRRGREPEFQALVSHARIGRRQSIALACSYAMSLDLPTVFWKEDLTYAWT